MKSSLIKCSDERSRCFSIITSIGMEAGKKVVTKEAVYPEGKAHLQDVLRYQETLKKAYPAVRICPVVMEDEKLVFDFIRGESLEERYRRALGNRDRSGFERLLTEHRNLLYENPENETVFSGGENFTRRFGDPAPYEGRPGFRVSNFDAIAGNILYTEESTVFIDYEWVMDFPMPQELVVYHCIRDLYYHLEELEEFYPLQEAMKFLGITTDLETLQTGYLSFWHDVVREKDGSSFALSKALLLKGTYGEKDIPQMLENERKENTELRQKLQDASDGWKKSSEATEYAHRMWKECSQAVSELNAKLTRQAKDSAAEKEGMKADFDRRYAALEQEYQKLNADRDIWKGRYQAVISTKSWRMVNKVRKAMHKSE